MNYQKIVKGIFLQRINRFIAHVLISGELTSVHIKNTGRFKELLIPDAIVYLEDHGYMPGRKTRYSLIAVEKGERLINLDSQITNKVVSEALTSGKLKLPGFGNGIYIRPEVSFDNSRFDFYIENRSDKGFVEVKAVTLEESGVAKFPDAPTLRGIRHLKGLTKAITQGYKAYVVFIVQMENVLHLEPNYKTHKAFGEALYESKKAGVNLLAYQCMVSPESITLDKSIPIIIKR